uniref:Plectin/eS10 N-terminal domain-containing protein n=1 Tax=Amphilophus citrinellus TaxID=61819 RepID=A0A3Q0SQ46_AMPCI
MVMPLANLKAIYELLFRDGIIVVKKDRRPQSMHPDLKGVNNLKVIRTMGSLKSKGYVRETFAWKHGYYYLTNEGILYLRDYLHLPPEIMPTTLHRICCPPSSARVQRVKGQTSSMSELKARGIKQDLMDRDIYRHKKQPDRLPKTFRVIHLIFNEHLIPSVIPQKYIYTARLIPGRSIMCCINNNRDCRTTLYIS